MAEKPALTDMELKLVDMLGSCNRLWRAIYDDTRASSRQRQNDLAEFAGHIHDLQYRVMAQAARRAYPDRFR